MLSLLSSIDVPLAAGELPNWLYNTIVFAKVLIGFSIIIFVHELGHFLAAKSSGIRVDRFAIGFGTRVCGYRKGEGLTFGNRPEYNADDLEKRGYGETDYCVKALPVGGYVKMLGQDDIIVNEETGEMSLTDDPRAFTSKPIGKRMFVVSAGVIFNLLFAGLLLIAVFMIGLEQPAPVIGFAEPDGVAQGALLPGDRIKEINGHEIYSFQEILMETALGDEIAHIKLERDGKIIEVDVPTAKSEIAGVRLLNIGPIITTKLIANGTPVGDLPSLKAGDIITHIDDRPVSSGAEVTEIFERSGGKTLKCTVRRPTEDDPDVHETLECYQRAILFVLPATVAGGPPGNSVDNSHMLGLRRRRKVDSVDRGDPADRAGMKAGDIIVTWGGVLNPNYAEIVESIQAHAGKETTVVVERDGEDVSLKITPARPFRLFGQARARVGIAFSLGGEENKPIVADVAPDTPFAALNVPRGALLLSIGDRPVSTWFDAVAALKDAAGRTIPVSYRTGGDVVTGEVVVPSSIINELGLPPGVIIRSIDGQKSVAVKARGGGKVDSPVGRPAALRQFLETKIGQTVAVRYSPSSSESAREATFTVCEDNIDPWQLRIAHFFDPRVFSEKKELVQTNNPIEAARMSGSYVVTQLRQIYTLLTKLANRSVGTKSVAGPVGIFKIAYQKAESGYAPLMLFLAFLSVNLAVINFLPMPVMDGGLMVFLIIEKIKGSPLSLKAQMISTMVGLAAILLIAVAVTVQDIGRFF